MDFGVLATGGGQGSRGATCYYNAVDESGFYSDAYTYERNSPGRAYALVDSGATHALRRANSQEEWNGADPVTVNLAGGETVALRINKAGTILVPITNLQNASRRLSPWELWYSNLGIR